ncbi:MAG: hypothetical protein NVSMB29_18250 [Candidatus Dormibacteria bacterium]
MPGRPLRQHLQGWHKPSRPPGGKVVLTLAVAAAVAVQVLLWIALLTVGRSLAAHVYGSGLVNRLVEATELLLAVLAAVVITRRPRNPVGWLLLASCFFTVLSSVMALYASLDIQVWHRAAPAGDLVAGMQSYLWIPEIGCLAVLPAQLFPDGRLVSRRWRLALFLSIASVIGGCIGSTFGPAPDTYLVPGAVAPKLHTGVAASLLGFLQIGLPLLVLCLLLAVLSLVVRYRRAASEVRHQIRWLLVSVVIYLIPFAAHGFFFVSSGADVHWLADLSLLGVLALPLAMLTAILKYRLYDIDVVINRALVYGGLAGFITAVYVSIVVGVGSLVGGGGRPNLLLSIVATALVAVAFQPVRERVQRLANRAVYGRRADPYELLSRFSAHIGDSYAPDEVLPRMAAVLGAGMGASRAAVWIRSGARLHEAAVWPAGAGDGERRTLPSSVPHTELPGADQVQPVLPGGDHVAAVRERGELLGALAVEKRAGETLTPIEQKLLHDLAQQAGLVLKNVGLTADLEARLQDLQASRQRLVAAQDDERRRLERNLHDGAQQNLVALKVKLGLAERFLEKNPARVLELIGELKGDTDETLSTLRDLARGIYPPLLADRGLVAALEAQARKATVSVELHAEGVARYSQELEAAVYFCVLEALQNVQKYAGAAGAVVSLRQRGDDLTFEVRDDGPGFDVATTSMGAGLQNMRDRLDALGGTLTVRTEVGAGTRVVGSLPALVAATSAA